MDVDRNLSTQKKREMFRARFHLMVEAEANRLCKSKACAELLAEYVFLRVELDYRSRMLPAYCEPFLIGQTCLAYAAMGDNVEGIKTSIEALKTKQEEAYGNEDA